MNPSDPGILLLGPDNYFYRRILSHFAEGFSLAGCRVFWHAGAVESDAVADFARNNDLQLVLEINAMLGPAENWPENVYVSTWYHDHYFRKEYLDVDTSKSKSYFLFDPAVFGLDIPPDHAWSYLPPGATLTALEDPRTTFRRDVSFCGYIPRPIQNYQVAEDASGTPVHLNRFLQFYPSSFYTQSTFDLPASRRRLDEICERLNCKMLPHAYRFFEDTLVRFHERASLLWKLRKVTDSIDIFGIEHWKQWEQFAPYYRGPIEDSSELTELYRSSKINIHNGTIGLHFRVFDCLAAGGFLLALKTPRDTDLAGISSVFEPGKHFDHFTVEEVPEVFSRYLEDDELRYKIAAEGMKLVRSKHTWRNRAMDVLDDHGICSNRDHTGDAAREVESIAREVGGANKNIADG